MSTHNLSCLICGHALEYLRLDADHAPYRCPQCMRGWFIAELENREHWDSHRHHFRAPVRALVTKKIHAEVALARSRGKK